MTSLVFVGLARQLIDRVRGEPSRAEGKRATPAGYIGYEPPHFISVDNLCVGPQSQTSNTTDK